MDNSTHHSSESGGPNPTSGEATSAQSQSQASKSLREALRKGAEDAQAAAEKAAPIVKAAVAEGTYWTAYGFTFVAAFHWYFAKGITPESVKSGVRDGIQGGRRVAEEWIDKLTKRSQATDATAGSGSPPTGAAQPGAV